MNPRDKGILKHILTYCSQISTTRERFGDDQTIFYNDFVYQNAIALCLLQIGELVGNLTEDYKNMHSDIPWRQIKAVRNIVAHHYGFIDSETIWEILQKDIPDLQSYCENELSSDSSTKKTAS